VNIAVISAGVTLALLGSVMLGAMVRPRLKEHHLNSETRDSVKLAAGLVATMSALLLGLLLGAANNSYNTARDNVNHLAANVIVLDRLLGSYGPEVEPLRVRFRGAVEETVRQLWGSGDAMPAAKVADGDALFAKLRTLEPRDDMQRALKEQASDLARDLAKLRAAMRVQAMPSVSMPLLMTVTGWLVLIFFGFSLIAPPNRVATLATLAAALAVAGAILLIMELDRPFSGMLQLPRESLAAALEAPAR
jgi:hypothetical protein